MRIHWPSSEMSHRVGAFGARTLGLGILLLCLENRLTVKTRVSEDAPVPLGHKASAPGLEMHPGIPYLHQWRQLRLCHI